MKGAIKLGENGKDDLATAIGALDRAAWRRQGGQRTSACFACRRPNGPERRERVEKPR